MEIRRETSYREYTRGGGTRTDAQTFTVNVDDVLEGVHEMHDTSGDLAVDVSRAVRDRDKQKGQWVAYRLMPWHRGNAATFTGEFFIGDDEEVEDSTYGAATIRRFRIGERGRYNSRGEFVPSTRARDVA